MKRGLKFWKESKSMAPSAVNESANDMTAPASDATLADLAQLAERSAELKARIEILHVELNAWIDSRAAELKASHAEIPIGVLRTCIAGPDRSCPCRGALHIAAADARDAKLRERQAQQSKE